MNHRFFESITAEERSVLLEFIALFMRWECGLKRSGFVLKGRHGEAQANWKGYAGALDFADLLAACGPAVKYVQEHPPLRQMYEEDVDGIHTPWRPNPRRADEKVDAVYLLRVLHDIRNNLFHGGKYPGRQVSEIARNVRLMRSATEVLDGIMTMDRRFELVLEEASHPAA